MPFCYQRQNKGLSLWPYESAKATRWGLQSSDLTTLHWFYLPVIHPQAIKHDEMTVFRVHLVLSHGLVLSSLRFQQDMFSPAWVAVEQTRWSFNYACSCSMGSGQGLHNDKVCPQHSKINSKFRLCNQLSSIALFFSQAKGETTFHRPGQARAP